MCTIEFNKYDDKIDMITKYETEFLNICEKITLDKFIDNDIKTLQAKNKIICEDIGKLIQQNIEFKDQNIYYVKMLRNYKK